MTTTPRNTPEQIRFWSKVKTGLPNQCWIWIGSTNSDGYGRFRADIGLIQAHRYAYELIYGKQNEPCILHTCDNPTCINPMHLFAGNQSDNMRDMSDKGRHAWAKLKINAVKEIRRRVTNGESQQSIADDFNISQGLVSAIYRGRVWPRW